MRCGACDREHPLASGERVGFRDECAACHADLHACRSCAHHDPGAYNQCREPGAERVSDRERANRCEWFVPRSEASRSNAGETRARSLDALQALFDPKRRS